MILFFPVRFRSVHLLVRLDSCHSQEIPLCPPRNERMRSSLESVLVFGLRRYDLPPRRFVSSDVPRVTVNGRVSV